MSELFSVSIQLKRPSGNDPGAAEVAKYTVETSVAADKRSGGNMATIVTLVDSEGKPLPREARRRSRKGEPPEVLRWERVIGPGEDARQAARSLLMERYRSRKQGSDFNRPLNYGPTGYY